MPAEKTVLLLSGGIDSTTLLYFALDAGDDVLPLTIDYGQRHRKEIESAARVSEQAGCGLTRLSLPALGPAFAGTALTDAGVPVPHGHYEDASMRATVVPNRNMVLISIAAAFAISRGAATVAFAAHTGDHAIYPDCRPEFIAAMERVLATAHYSPVRLLAPFASWRKAGIVRWGADRGVPFELTWSCYEGGDHHCGRCGTCIERREAFELAGVSDPTIYEGTRKRGAPPERNRITREGGT